VAAREGSPSLAGWLPPVHHAFGDARLLDLQLRLKKFAVNPWHASKRIFNGSFPRSMRAAWCQSVIALPVAVISNASSRENRPWTNTLASRAGRSAQIGPVRGGCCGLSSGSLAAVAREVRPSEIQDLLCGSSYLGERCVHRRRCPTGSGVRRRKISVSDADRHIFGAIT
jgi:hypothetical protein